MVTLAPPRVVGNTPLTNVAPTPAEVLRFEPKIETMAPGESWYPGAPNGNKLAALTTPPWGTVGAWANVIAETKKQRVKLKQRVRCIVKISSRGSIT
jgi:hypothetical protein